MRRRPDISLIVSSFERPSNLLRCLHSIGAQRGVQDAIEVVVADDGSRDETPDVVEAFARETSLPVTLTTHDHNGFRLARSRNEGTLASSGDYLLFTDADCVLPPEFLQRHLRARRHGRVMVGCCYRLEEEASQEITVAAIRSGGVSPAVPRREAKRVFLSALRARYYQWLRVSMRPRLSGSNMGVWRDDCERINGFDENFVGWGMEDTDFQRRLEGIGVRSRWTRTGVFHLWHPPHPTSARGSLGTPNYRYFHRPDGVSPRCRKGLDGRSLLEFERRTIGGRRLPTDGVVAREA